MQRTQSSLTLRSLCRYVWQLIHASPCSAEKNKLFHGESYAYTIVVLGEVADGLDGRVAAHGCHCLQEREDLLRLKKDIDASAVALHVAVEVQKQTLKGNLRRGSIIGILSTETLTKDLRGERAIVGECNPGVAAAETQSAVLCLELVLHFRSSHFTTCLCQCIV